MTACTSLAKMYSYRSEGHAADYIDTMMFISHSVQAEALHGAVHHPDLGLEGTPRDRFELHQKHIVKLHETLTNFPLSIGGPVYRM